MGREFTDKALVFDFDVYRIFRVNHCAVRARLFAFVRLITGCF